MTAVISVKIPNPEFEGQTKNKLGNPEVRGYVDKVMSEYFGYYLEENPAEEDCGEGNFGSSCTKSSEGSTR